MKKLIKLRRKGDRKASRFGRQDFSIRWNTLRREFGKRLLQLRKGKPTKVSQNEFAKNLGIAERTLGQLERGIYESPGVLKEIWKFSQMSTEELREIGIDVQKVNRLTPQDLEHLRLRDTIERIFSHQATTDLEMATSEASSISVTSDESHQWKIPSTKTDTERIALPFVASPSFPKAADAIASSGIYLFAQNTGHFRDITNVEYGEYVRRLVETSRDGTTCKILGLDCAELFGDISGISERYVSFLRAHKQNVFQVLILDPRCEIGLQKRLSEWKLVRRYGADMPTRIYEKILGSIRIMVEYHKRFPKQFGYKFIRELPLAFCVMNDATAVFQLYSRCHKGWDSPVLAVNRNEQGIYLFLNEYFDFLWENPTVDQLEPCFVSHKEKASKFREEFQSLVAEGCRNHQKCLKPNV